MNSSKYPNSFKFANITPAFKQGSRNFKDNYRLISILKLQTEKKHFNKCVFNAQFNYCPFV